MSPTYFLEPVDGWSFRDGRPFEAGEAFEARSLFPPAAWTSLGCIRTALLRRHCPLPERYAGRGTAGSCPRCGEGPCAAEDVVGPAGGSAPFSLGPPLLAWRRTQDSADVFYPCPVDLVCEEGGNAESWRVLSPMPVVDGATHSLAPLRPIGLLGRERFHPGPQWITVTELAAYLHGRTVTRSGPCASAGCWDGFSRRGTAPMVYQEPRIGVGIDPASRSARQGQIYLRDVVRLEEGGGLVIKADKPLDLDGEVGRLGGDGRMVTFHTVSVPSDPSPPERLEQGRLKVYFAAPTWFEGGWRPRWIDTATLEGSPPGLVARLRLVGAAISESLALGGWDLKHQRPRAMRRLVGPGAVYYFDLVDGQTEAVSRVLHGRPLCDDPTMAGAGFGLAFIGGY